MLKEIKETLLKRKRQIIDERSQEEKKIDRICFFKVLGLDDFRKTLDKINEGQ